MPLIFRRIQPLVTQVVAAALAGIFSVTALAHHSFSQFDPSKSIQIEGTVVKFEWTNPHAWLWIAVPDGKGNYDTWGAENKSPAGLERDGWTKRTFNPGDKITLTLHPMRNGSKSGEFVKAVFPGGKVVESPLGPATGSSSPAP